MKSVAILSILFGVGLATQSDRIGDEPYAGWLLRRQAVLFALGVIHATLFWNGDILFLYALVGLAVGYTRKTSNWCLIAMAMLGIISTITLSLFFKDRLMATWADSMPLARFAYLNGTLSQSIRFQIFEFLSTVIHGRLLVGPLIFAFFVLGMYLWRLGVLQNPEANRRFIRRGLHLALWPGLALACVPYILSELEISVPDRWKSIYESSSLILFPIPLAIGYIFLILEGLNNRFWKKILNPFQYLGRMTLTGYLCQTMVFIIVFRGWGFGQGGVHGPAWLLVFGLIFFSIQVVFSAWWLNNYSSGPMEWAWRRLAYKKTNK